MQSRMAESAERLQEHICDHVCRWTYTCGDPEEIEGHCSECKVPGDIKEIVSAGLQAEVLVEIPGTTFCGHQLYYKEDRHEGKN